MYSGMSGSEESTPSNIKEGKQQQLIGIRRNFAYSC